MAITSSRYVRCLSAGMFSAALLLSLASASATERLPSAFACLPEQTVFMLRLPTPAASLKHFGEQTRVGAIWTDLNRWVTLANVLLPAKRDELVALLREYRLGLDDLTRLGDGEAGVAAVSIHDGRGILSIAWFEPNDESADRLVAAARQLVGEWIAEDWSIKRVEVELAEAKLLRVTWTEDAAPPEEDQVSADEDDHDDYYYAGDESPPEAAKPTISKPIESNLFLLRIGNRLAVAEHEWIDDASHDREESKRALDSCQELLGRFAASHRSGDGGALARFSGASDSSAAKPAGDLFVEAFLDPRLALNWLAEDFLSGVADETDDKESKVQTNALLESLALDDLRMVSYRATFDQNLVRAEVQMSVAAPRRGAWSIFDQKPFQPIEPAWVPADALILTQFSLDIGKAYRQMEHGLGTLFEFDAMERKIFHLPLPFLSTLGPQHTVISFASSPQNLVLRRPTEHIGLVRQAFVCPAKGEELWDLALQVGEVFELGERVSKQGFEGLEFNQLGVSGGMFFGQGSLVVGIGDRVVETVLAGLLSPPTGPAALVNSRVYQRARELLPPEPAVFYQFNDQSGTGDQPNCAFLEAVLWLMAVEPEDLVDIVGGPDQFAEFSAVFPARDFQGAFGVTVHQATVNDRGLTVRAVTELTPP